jgi:ubiquinone/menaquinone biosynthesis C-methylase UbiE
MNSTSYPDWVHESSFGKWFLNTETWVTHVIQVAINDLVTCMDNPHQPVSTILDVGVGFGKTLWNLDRTFHPDRIIGLDVDPEVLVQAEKEGRNCHANVELIQCNATQINLPDHSVDMIFCHQTFHHIVDQDSAIKEFYRVLNPGGRLLFAESTRKYIHSWVIKWLFRHPMDVQKTAEEYLQLIRATSFSCLNHNISYPYLWWSRADLGIMEHWFRRPVHSNREETLINLVATKPLEENQ